MPSNITAIRQGRYPLAYSITLIYPRAHRRAAIGEAFTDVLRTDEGQLLLQSAGVIPLWEIAPGANQPLTFEPYISFPGSKPLCHQDG